LLHAVGSFKITFTKIKVGLNLILPLYFSHKLIILKCVYAKLIHRAGLSHKKSEIYCGTSDHSFLSIKR